MNSYNTIDEIRKYMISKGFHEYDPPPIDNYSCTCFQKRYDDEIGKKYFIEAKVGDFTQFTNIPMRYHLSYDCQLYQKDTHDAFNIEFIDWKLEQVEAFIGDMFSTGKLDYYETWEES